MPRGVFSNGGLAILFASTTLSFNGSVLRVMRLYQADFTPVSGFTEADLDLLGPTEALATFFSAWNTAVNVADGVYKRTTSAAWDFEFSAGLDDTLVYGYCIVNNVGSNVALFAQRFDDAPLIVNADSVLSVHPTIYLRNWDVEVP